MPTSVAKSACLLQSTTYILLGSLSVLEMHPFLVLTTTKVVSVGGGDSKSNVSKGEGEFIFI